MKIISFSLWGNDKMYCQGAIDNIELAKKHYPGWICKFFVESLCPALPVLKNMDCIVCEIENNVAKSDPLYVEYHAIDRTKDDWHMDLAHKGMLWRFMTIDDPDTEVAIFRDCDSRIGAREANAVNEWLDSPHIMHRMHECKEHWNAQVMGGMWGIKTNGVSGVTASIADYVKKYREIRNEAWIFVDLWWIMDVLWPNFHNNCMGHGFRHPLDFSVDGPMVGGVVHDDWRGVKYVQ